MFKNIMIICSSILLIVLIVIFIIRKNSNIKVSIIEQSYNLISTVTEDDYVVFPILVNEKNSFISDKNKISSAYLTDKEQLDTLKLKIIDIQLLNNVKIEKNTYYLYEFKFKIDFYPNSDFLNTIEELYLKVDYLEDVDLFIKAGSLQYQKISNFINEDIAIRSFKGIVNKINNKDKIVGVVIKISNESINPINIKTINFVANKMNLGNEYLEVNFDEINCYDSIEEIMKCKYESIQINNSLNLEIKDEKTYLFSIVNNNEYCVNKMGIEIVYELDGNINKYYLDDFLFYADNDYVINFDELNFYVYENK